MSKNPIPCEALALPDFYSGDDYSLEESIGYLIKQAQVALHRTIDAKMAALDLTAMQWGPLILIAHGKASTAADLARCVGVKTSSITRMLDRLEAKNLLTRRRSQNDRRIIFLELTEEGRRLAAEVPYLIAESFNQHLLGFSKEELETLKSQLRRIANNSGN